MAIVDHLVNVALLGATWVLYLLFFLSLASFATMMERWIFFKRNRRGAQTLAFGLHRAISADDEDELRSVLSANTTIEGRVLSEAFSFRSGGPGAFADAVESGMARARQSLDHGTTLLGTIGNNAPFIGLFGTVLGVIEAFSYLSGGEEAMARVMAGIAEALVATAVGIFVAIPAVVGFNLAQKNSGEVETRIVSLAKLLSAWLQVRSHESRHVNIGDDEFSLGGRR